MLVHASFCVYRKTLGLFQSINAEVLMNKLMHDLLFIAEPVRSMPCVKFHALCVFAAT